MGEWGGAWGVDGHTDERKLIVTRRRERTADRSVESYNERVCNWILPQHDSKETERKILRQN